MYLFKISNPSDRQSRHSVKGLHKPEIFKKLMFVFLFFKLKKIAFYYKVIEKIGTARRIGTAKITFHIHKTLNAR